MPSHAHAAEQTWLGALFRSAGDCYSRFLKKPQLETVEGYAMNRVIEQYSQAREIQEALRLQKGVIIEHAKKVCGSEFCTVEQAAIVLKRVVNRHLDRIQASVPKNELSQANSVVSGYVEMAMPWVFLAGFGLVLGGSFSSNMGEILQWGGGALLLTAIAGIMKHRHRWKAQQAMRAFFETVPADSAYWENKTEPQPDKKTSTDSSVPKNDAGGKSARRIRADILAMEFNDIPANKFIENLNRSPEKFFSALAAKDNDTIAIWLAETLEFSSKLDSNSLQIPVQVSTLLKSQLDGMTVVRRELIYARMYALHAELHSNSLDLFQRYGKEINDLLNLPNG